MIKCSSSFWDDCVIVGATGYKLVFMDQRVVVYVASFVKLGVFRGLELVVVHGHLIVDISEA